MATQYEQTEQTIHGFQINAGESVTAEQVGDRYQIDHAQFNLPLESIRQLLSAFDQKQGEDYACAELEHQSWEPETVLIPAGSFLMGSDPEEGIPDWETRQFTMDLPAYRIGKYPVTNAEFALFMQETKRFAAKGLGWRNGQPSPEQNNLPVMGVTWYDALAYCVWLYEKTERPYTLPSEVQWEKAARGTDGFIFPWGNEWQEGMCNTDHQQVTAVDQYPHNESQFGCCDMIGNVREWTTTAWGRNRRYNVDFKSPYPWTTWKVNEGSDRINAHPQMRRVTRGGASLLPDIPLRIARRQSELPYRHGTRQNRVGFRVVLNWGT